MEVGWFFLIPQNTAGVSQEENIAAISQKIVAYSDQVSNTEMIMTEKNKHKLKHKMPLYCSSKVIKVSEWSLNKPSCSEKCPWRHVNNHTVHCSLQLLTWEPATFICQQQTPDLPSNWSCRQANSPWSLFAPASFRHCVCLCAREGDSHVTQHLNYFRREIGRYSMFVFFFFLTKFLIFKVWNFVTIRFNCLGDVCSSFFLWNLSCV